MHVLKPEIDCGDFLQDLGAARFGVLLLDYDGTIAPFTVHRRAARPYPGVLELIELVMNTSPTRVVMITGRPAGELLSMLDISPQPEIWGSHGLERLEPDGTYHMSTIPLEELAVLMEAEGWLLREHLESRIEAKPGAVAVNWRGLTDSHLHEARIAAYRALLPIASRSGLALHEFDGGLELRLRNRNKGAAVRTILDEVGDGTPAAYLGDDLTDEDAFRALRARDLGVLVRHELRRGTAAGIWIRPPEELLQFLTDWTIASRGAA